MLEEVLHKKGFWAIQGPQNHVVLSSRLRLARNMEGICFPNKYEAGEPAILKNAAERFAFKSSYADSVNIIELQFLGNNEKRLLRERNLITSEMEFSENSFVLVSKNGEFTILFNEEDHVRIQIIKPGLQLLEAYHIADKVDDELNKYIPYAFSDDLGFLTSCISNVGTGLRVSVLVHLPVINKKNEIGEITERLRKRGIELKGILPNSNKTLGSIYQLSNRISLGMSEVDIIETIDGFANELIEHEDYERDLYFSENRSEMEDKILRSYGLLHYSKRMTYIEALEHLSNIRLGTVLAIIKNIDLNDINDIMVNIQWSHLQRKANRIFITTTECDEYRSEYLKSVIH